MLIIARLYADKPKKKLTFQVISEDLCDSE